MIPWWYRRSSLRIAAGSATICEHSLFLVHNSDSNQFQIPIPITPPIPISPIVVAKSLGINEFIDLRQSFFCLFTSSTATSHENSTHVATSSKFWRIPLPEIQSTARPSRAEALCKLFAGFRQSQNFPSSSPLAID